jgi:DUF1680 family protein
VGHLYEAAVAYYEATGKRPLLEVAIRNADLLCRTFGPGKRNIASGHQEIEIGLVKLYRITGNGQYLDLAKFLLDQRGKGEKHGSTYTQDHLPVIEQQEAVGHAVRACYMYTAMADIAALTGDTAYLAAIDRIWQDVITGKTYLTGGIGSRSAGEAFGDRYELPNLTAYNETCAAIASVFWNYRMFLLHGESKYIDVLERALYNGVISGVSLEGTTFFYPNLLESEGNYARSEWFDCSCCPSNISRFLPSVPGYIYATRADSLFVNLYIGSAGKVILNGKSILITQKTNYPWDGKIIIALSPEKPVPVTLCLRIPGWARNEVIPGDLYRFNDVFIQQPALRVNGKMRPLHQSGGYATVTQIWKKGDTVVLSVPMPVRKVVASDQIYEDRGKVALTRGPLVFCAEGIDNEGDVKNLVVPLDSTFSYTFNAGLLNGVGTLTGNVRKLTGDGFNQAIVFRPSALVLRPYYAWCHRGAGTMNVWFTNDTYVFPPLMDPPESIFLDTIPVRLKQYTGQQVWYSAGDEYPDQQASRYNGSPVILSETATLSAAAFNGTGQSSDLVNGRFSKVSLIPSVVVTGARPGLICRYYEGRFRKLPDFDSLVPVRTSVVTHLDAVAIRDTADAYALEFEGWILLPEDGIYTFIIRSDDGGRILIHGKEVVVNDGLHEITERSGQAALAHGFHPFSVQFFDYGADEGLEVLIAGPGTGRQPVPDDWFWTNPRE